jgi:hypothetical protein
MTTESRLPIGRKRSSRLGRFVFAEEASRIWTACALLALEVVPVYAWLVVVAAYGGGADQAAIPLWLLALVGVGYWRIGGISARWGRAAATLLAILLGGAAALLAIGLAATAGEPARLFDGAWLMGYLDQLALGGSTVSVSVLTVLLFAFLGWRAMASGLRAPDVSGVKRRFAFSFSALALAAITLVGLPPDARPLPVGWLSLLLPLDVFAGLLAAALARRLEAQTGQVESSQIDATRWLGVALILSGLVVLIALVVSAFINVDGVDALLGHLGPVGKALDAALNGVILTVANALSALFDGPLTALQRATQSAGSTTVQQPPRNTTGPTGARASAQNGWRIVALALMSILSSVGLILIALGFMRVLRRDAQNADDDTAAEEERTALDGATLLREQVQEIFARFRRGEQRAVKVIPPGSVRHIYRTVLNAARARGLARSSAETSDEFADRMTAALGDAGATVDVAAVTDAYNVARYAEQEPEKAELEAVKASATRLARALKPG